MLKTLPASVKAVDDSDSGEGIVEALVATYDVDSGNDKIMPGAFTKSLDEWAQRTADNGEHIPFIWSHMHDDLDAYLGDVLEAREIDEGLWVRAQLDMTDDRARKAFKLIKGGRVRNYSFAYEIEDSEEDGDVLLLKQLKLYEVGPTLIGMNQQTRTLVAKSSTTNSTNSMSNVIISAADLPTLQLKIGRVLSATNEQSLRDAYDAIGRVLAQIDAQSSDDDSKSNSNTTQGDATQPAEPVKLDEPDRVKSDEPMPFGPADEDLELAMSLRLRKGVNA